MSSKACRVVRGLGAAATAARSIGDSTVPGEILIPRIFSEHGRLPLRMYEQSRLHGAWNMQRDLTVN